MDRPDRVTKAPFPASETQSVIKRICIDRRIRAFLRGETHGQDILQALYGGVTSEPVPERLLALLKA